MNDTNEISREQSRVSSIVLTMADLKAEATAREDRKGLMKWVLDWQTQSII